MAGLLDFFMGGQPPAAGGIGSDYVAGQTNTGLLGGSLPNGMALSSVLGNNSNALLGFGLGLMSGNRQQSMQNALSGMMLGQASDRQKSKDAEDRADKARREAATKALLLANGYDEATASRLSAAGTDAALTLKRMQQEQQNADRSYGLQKQGADLEQKRYGLAERQYNEGLVPVEPGATIYRRSDLTGSGGGGASAMGAPSSPNMPGMAGVGGGQPTLPPMPGNTAMPQAGGPPKPLVSVPGKDLAGEAFAKTTAEGQAKAYTEMAADLPAAQRDIGQLQVLRQSLAKTPGGFMGGAQAVASRWGIKLGDSAGNMEYAQAVLARLTPMQRIAGSGTTSDRDLALFQQSLPQLSNTKEGNALIIDTLDAVAQDRVLRGQIAAKVQNGEMTLKQGNAALQALPNPFQKFTDTQLGPVTGGAPTANPGGGPVAPTVQSGADPVEAELRRRGLLK